MPTLIKHNYPKDQAIILVNILAKELQLVK